MSFEEQISLQRSDPFEGAKVVKVLEQFFVNVRDTVPFVDFEETEAEGGLEQEEYHYRGSVKINERLNGV